MSKQIQVKKNEIPEGWSIEGADFINRVHYFKTKLILNTYILIISSYKENLVKDLDYEEPQR